MIRTIAEAPRVEEVIIFGLVRLAQSIRRRMGGWARAWGRSHAGCFVRTRVPRLSRVAWGPNRVACCLHMCCRKDVSLLTCLHVMRARWLWGEGGGWGRTDVARCPEVSSDTSSPIVSVRESVKFVILIVCAYIIICSTASATLFQHRDYPLTLTLALSHKIYLLKINFSR